MRAVIFPYGVRRRAPSDALAAECAEILLAPSSARDRLTGGIYRPRGNDEVAMLDRAFIQVDQSAAVRQRQRKGEALSAAETAALEETDRLVRMVIGVDDFDPDALTITARSAQFDATPQRRVV